jgi:large-conductance mechanosensitive channel
MSQSVAGSWISVIGNILIIAVAVWVGVMAVLQARSQKQWAVENRV